MYNKITFITGYSIEKRISMNIYVDYLYKFLHCIRNQYNIKILRLISPKYSFNRLLYLFEKYIILPFSIARVDSDIYHIVDHTYAHVIKYISSKKIKVVTIHDLIPILAYENKIQGLSYPHNPILFKYSMRFIDKANSIITVSENTKNDIINIFKINPNKIKVIYPGIDPSFKKLDHVVINNFILSKNLIQYRNYKLILLSGNTEYKNHITALNVLKQFINKFNINIKFVFTGKLNKSVNEFIIQNDLEAFIIHIEYVNNKEMPALYNLVDCLFFPSFYEGFGFPILESMACGTPVLTSTSGSIPEIVNNAAVMHSPESINEYIESLFLILSNEHFRDDLIQKGLSNSRRFTWDKTAKETKELYDKLIIN